jgi:hypothetical protein
LVVNIRHWLNEHDEPAAPQLRRRVWRIARLIEYGGTLKPGETRLTLIECSRRPKRKPCEGLLWVTKTEDDYLYAWCPTCQDESLTISGWQDTLYADGPPEPLPPLPPQAASDWN